MTAPGFSRVAILGLLGELEARLQKRGITMDIQIVGGAALILHGLLERSTEDIDARYSNKVIDEIAADMTSDYGLPGGWLNSRAMAFIPDGAEWAMNIPGIPAAVSLADLPTLAAMKLAAERSKDIEDLGRVAIALGIDDPRKLVDLAFEKYGDDAIPLSAGRENYMIVANEALAAGRAQRDRKRKPL